MQRLKFIAQIAGGFLAIPAILHAHLAMALLGRARGFSIASESVARQSGLLSLYTRQAFYRHFLANFGSDIHIGFMTLFSKPNASLGNRVYLGRFCIVGLAEIHDDVMIADGVQILSGRHHHGRDTAPHQSLRDNPVSFEKITIGRGAWIGAGAIVMANVGEGAIVGAGAVVVQPVPANAKVAGVPAKPLSAPAITNHAA